MADLITNGSFEMGIGTSATGWTSTGPGRVDRTAGLAGDGTGWFALGADSLSHGGAIQQTITTEAGKTYTVIFKSGIGWQANASGKVMAGLKVEALAGAALRAPNKTGFGALA